MISTLRADSGFDRAGLALRYERSAISERSGDFKQAIEGNPFSNGFSNGKNLNSDDSLAITLIALHFAQLPAASPALLEGAQYCPLCYRRAATEMASEIKAEQDFLRDEPH